MGEKGYWTLQQGYKSFFHGGTGHGEQQIITFNTVHTATRFRSNSKSILRVHTSMVMCYEFHELVAFSALGTHAKWYFRTWALCFIDASSRYKNDRSDGTEQ